MRVNFSEPTTPGVSRQTSRLFAPQLQRMGTYPHLLTARRKPRRWPLVFRFVKGAIHGAIILSVIFHALFTSFVVYLDQYVFDTVGLPSSIVSTLHYPEISRRRLISQIPSLSIVVGLMLVFRNQTSYSRFWDGRNATTTVYTCIRNLVRTTITNGYSTKRPLNEAEKQDIERTIRTLMAMPYAIKNHLRAEWGATLALGDDVGENGISKYDVDYASLLPADVEGHEDEGLGLPFQLTFFIDGFIKRGVEREWFNAPAASQMQAQLNTLVDAYGKMETIKLTPIPVAHLIHQKQVLALFGCVIPFGMVDDLGWWTVPIASLVIFTLYGIEGIGSQLEDPFGYDRNDIKMDAIAGDAKTEIDAVLGEWRRLMATVQPLDQTGDGSVDDKYVPPEMFIRVKPRPGQQH